MASVSSQLIDGVTAHAQSDSLEDAREICADSNYFPNNLRTVFVNNQLHTQFFFLYLFIPILYMFRATKCSSSGEW